MDTQYIAQKAAGLTSFETTTEGLKIYCKDIHNDIGELIGVDRRHFTESDYASGIKANQNDQDALTNIEALQADQAAHS